MNAIWDAAKTQIQPCLAYIVRMIPIDSQLEMIEADRVQTRVAVMGKVTP